MQVGTDMLDVAWPVNVNCKRSRYGVPGLTSNNRYAVNSVVAIGYLVNVGIVHADEMIPVSLGEDRAAMVAAVEHQPSSVARNLARLRSMVSWRDNWDGEGGAAPDKAILKTAERLLGLLSFIDVEFSVDLDADSRPSFTPRKPGWSGFVTVESTGELSFSFETEGREDIDDFHVSFDGTLPSGLQAALATLSAA